MVNDEGQGMTDAGTAGMPGNGYAEGAAAVRLEQPRRVDPLHFPLWGSRLIEASAGTGKTYTIAALYLRLVLGHGERGTAGLDAAYPPEADMGFLEGAKPSEKATAFREALTPPKILVVTFPEAATLGSHPGAAGRGRRFLPGQCRSRRDGSRSGCHGSGERS